MLADDRHVDRPGRPGVELLPGVPTDLNRMLAAGEIDLGPVSSIAYARNHRRLLLSRTAEHLVAGGGGQHPAGDPASARPDPDGGPHPPERHLGGAAQDHPQAAIPAGRRLLRAGRARSTQALEEHDAVLLIGDQGLEALYFPIPGPPATIWALCGRSGPACPWCTPSGRPGRISPGATAPNFWRWRRNWSAAWTTAATICPRWSSRRSAGIASTAAGLTRYFARLRYDFTAEYREGLARFYELAHEAGELEEVPRLRFIDEVAAAPAAAAGRRSRRRRRGAGPGRRPP